MHTECQVFISLAWSDGLGLRLMILMGTDGLTFQTVELSACMRAHAENNVEMYLTNGMLRKIPMRREKFPIRNYLYRISLVLPQSLSDSNEISLIRKCYRDSELFPKGKS